MSYAILQTSQETHLDGAARACRKLWLTVIAEAVREYRNRRMASAEQFLFNRPQYFSLICELAGVNPECVQNAANCPHGYYPLKKLRLAPFSTAKRSGSIVDTLGGSHD